MVNRFVNKLSGFAELSGEECETLARVTSSPRTYGPRQDLIREGDKPGPVFVMLDGWAFRYKVLPRVCQCEVESARGGIGVVL